jgi:hypothetical protein
MYPDLLDITNSAQRIGLTVDPKAVYADVVLASRFLEFAKHRCYFHGSHHYIDATTLRGLVSEYTGLIPSTEAIVIALRFGRCKTKPTKLNVKEFGKSFDRLTIKFPPLDRLGEFTDDWERIQEETEKEIAVELQQPKFV